MWLAAMKRRKSCGPALPGARFGRPAAWTETDKENFDRFLKTPAGTKFLTTLHSLVVDRALSVCDRSPYEHGMTGGMSFLLGEIERLACEGEPEECDRMSETGDRQRG
jgi:hypothetical protein